MEKTTHSIDYSASAVELAKVAKALSHPIRLIILKYLSNQSCCFTGDLVKVLPIAQSTVSQHLKELKDAGLIQGTLNPPKINYCIHQENWDNAKLMMHTFFEEDFKKISCC